MGNQGGAGGQARGVDTDGNVLSARRARSSGLAKVQERGSRLLRGKEEDNRKYTCIFAHLKYLWGDREISIAYFLAPF